MSLVLENVMYQNDHCILQKTNAYSNLVNKKQLNQIKIISIKIIHIIEN